MAVLVPDDRQLGIQAGALGSRVQAPPPVPTDILNGAQKSSTETLNKLGQVISDEAVRQQNMLNEAIISDATTAALRGFTQSMSTQLERKGYQVYAQSETDTTPARASALDEFDAQTQGIVANAKPKFLNALQEEKYMDWVNKTLPGLRDTVAKHQSQQIFEQSQASQAARLKTTSDTVVTLSDAGLIDNMQQPLRDIKRIVPQMLSQRGASQEEITQETNNQLNTAIATSINKLIADGRTVEAAEIYSKYGTNLTGETAVSVRQAVQAGVDLVYADTLVQSTIGKAPKLADGSTDWDWVSSELMKSTASTERMVRVQGATATQSDYTNMAGALTNIIGFVESSGGVNTGATYGGRDTGSWQMDPKHRQDATDLYNKKYGTNLTPDQIDWSSFNQDGVAWQAVSLLMGHYLTKYKGDYEAVAIGWNGGDYWGEQYNAVPAGQREDWLNRHSAFKSYLYDENKFYYYAKQKPEWEQALRGGNEATVTTTTVMGYSPKLQSVVLQKLEYYKQQEAGTRKKNELNFITRTLDSGRQYQSLEEAVADARANGFTGEEAISVGKSVFQTTQIKRSDTAYQEAQVEKLQRRQSQEQARAQNEATEGIYTALINNPNLSENQIIAMAGNKIPAKTLYSIIQSAKSGKGTWASSYNTGIINQTLEQAGLEDDAVIKAHLYEDLSAQDAEKVRTKGEHINADEIRATALTYLRRKKISESPFATNPVAGEYGRFTSNGFVYSPSVFGAGTYSSDNVEYSYQKGTEGALVSGSSGDEWSD